MKKLFSFAAAMGVVLWTGSSDCSAAARDLKSLPTPVQAYIFKEAVESGIADPWSIVSNPDYDDRIAGTVKSDLNGDGRRDFAVALCMFNEQHREFLTNGYPCSFGALILSVNKNEYVTLPLFGLVIKGKSGATPTVVVRQRHYKDECDDYVCDFEYALERVENANWYELKQLRACPPDHC